MATKGRKTVIDPNVKVEEKEEVVLTPAEYFEKVKGRIKETTPEEIKLLFNTTIKQLQRFEITGQKDAAKELYAKALYLEKEYKLIQNGITKYVDRDLIDKYIDTVSDDCVCVIEMRNYDRIIPDEIVDTVVKIKDLVDEFYIVFTDYTGEKRSKVAKERRDKDPILFANIFTDGKVSPRMYFIGDWVDDYCDLTLDKMISEISKKEKKNKDEILFNIEDSFETIQSIEKSLFGVVKTKKGSDK